MEKAVEHNKESNKRGTKGKQIKKETTMIYEATITYITRDKNGNDKQAKESFIVDNVETFAQVEDLLYREFQDLTDIDVVAIKRSNINEIINKCNNVDEKIWLADIVQVFVDENGVEKEMRYKFAFFSLNTDTAFQYVNEYLKQGYTDMELVGLKKTRFQDIFKG